MNQVYYIRLGYDPKLFEALKKISSFLVLLISVYLLNYYNLKFNALFSSIYNIILYFILYAHFFQNNEDDFGNTKEKIAFALIVESIMISLQKYSYSKTNWIFWERTIEVTIAPNMFSLIISMIYGISILVRKNIKLSDKPKD